MFKKINFLLVVILVTSCVPISETTKSKLEFKESTATKDKDVKNDIPSGVNPAVTLTPAQLKLSVRKILDTSCLSCHGDGASFQAIANLAPSILEIEEEGTLISPKDLKGSILYQKITVGSMRDYLESPKDADVIKQWILSIGSTPAPAPVPAPTPSPSPSPVDTRAPLITKILPSGTTYEATVTSVKLDVTTDEAASCGFSTTSANTDYSKMTKFTTTGNKAHIHTVNSLKSGSYSYFIKCIDAAKNQSLSKEIKFAIKSAAVNPSPVVVLTPAELKVAVRKILDTKCLSCHGEGKSFQNIANLAPSISVIEANTSLVIPKDLNKSFLYQQVTVGKMKVYLTDPQDAVIIKDWILSLIPVPVDTKAPVITKFLPNGVTYEATVKSVKLDVTTDEASSCSFSTTSAYTDYSKMTKFTATGAKAHSHTVSSLKAGSYSYFIKCIDSAKNQSVVKEIKFTIKGVVVAAPPDPALKKYNSELQMTNRSYVESVLLQVFNAEGTAAATYIQSEIYQRIEFGGPCDQYSASDTGVSTSSTTEFARERCLNSIGVVQASNNNPMRYSITTKVCERLVADSARLNIVRNKLFSTQKWGEVTDDKVLLAWHLFHQASDANSDVINSLKNIRKVTSTNDDAWKFIILTLCISPEWQAL